MRQALDAAVLETFGDDFLGDLLEEVNVRQRRKRLQILPHAVIVDETICPHRSRGQCGEHLDRDLEAIGPLRMALPRMQAATPLHDRVRDHDPDMVAHGKFGMHGPFTEP